MSNAHITPALGETVLLIPQALAWMTNPHNPENLIGEPIEAAESILGQTQPRWEIFTSTLLRHGYGVMVVRDGKLRVGPSQWDSGD